MTSTPARGVPVVAPATVGPYTLLARIGEGGMGVVHLARKGPDGPRVALKVLRHQVVGDDEGRRRLEREVSSLRRIRSRWVAEILDADPWAPVPYVATRYVPGHALQDHVAEEGPLTGRDLTHFAACLAEGVASVHSVGVLHRDVKPSNVLMEGRTPILIDFGLARVADDPRLTHTGWLLGTPGYLAPEILHGDDATTAADIHSWAATVAFAATGRPPFGRGPSMAIMDRVRRGEHDLSGIPDPMRQLLAECLDPEPHQRPTLPMILGWLRPQLTGAAAGPTPPPAHIAPPPPPAPELTMPYAAAAAATADRPTDHLNADPSATFGRVTRVLPDPSESFGRVTRLMADPALPPPVPLGERARRAALLVAAALACGALTSAYPWLALVVLVVLVWLLRSGSQAASAAGDRRLRRGRKWYDGAQLLLHTPWHLVQSLPGTVMLVLWSLGWALAAALICYAVVAGQAVTLAVCGVLFAVGVHTGPGGSRIRSPLGRVVRPLSRSWKRWLAAFGVLVAVSLTLGSLADSLGPSWTPGHHRPFQGASHAADSR